MDIFANFNDDPLAEVLAAPAVAPKAPPAHYVPRSFIEGCPKCRGTGKFISYSGRVVGDCFACKGKGNKTFRSSPEQRAQGRAQAAVRREKAAAELTDAAAAFTQAHIEEIKWCIEAAPRFAFAQAMLDAVAKYGSLTENQLGAVRRCMAKDADRAKAREARKADAPVVDTAGVDRLKAAFDAAAAYAAQKATGLTIRNPKITVGGITISPAKATSANPGALYVKNGGEYLGKIAGGKFLAVAACTAEQSAKVLAFVNDPQQAAKAYGQETGVCCVCNAELRSEWRLRGIGPICAEKFGWGA